MFTNTALRPLLAPALALTLAVSVFTPHAAACDCGKSGKTASLSSTSAGTGQKEAPKKHPLKGVVTDVLTAQDALMVKHEAIPGVMRAMTMMFAVDPAVLKIVKKGDAITALMFRTDDGDWRLEDVKIIPPAPGT